MTPTELQAAVKRHRAATFPYTRRELDTMSLLADFTLKLFSTKPTTPEWLIKTWGWSYSSEGSGSLHLESPAISTDADKLLTSALGYTIRTNHFYIFTPRYRDEIPVAIGTLTQGQFTALMFSLGQYPLDA